MKKSLHDLQSLIDEHEKLVETLESRDDTKLKSELKKQKEELLEMKSADPEHPAIKKFMKRYGK